MGLSENRIHTGTMTYPPNIVHAAPNMADKADDVELAYYVNVEGALYGPYPSALMRKYVAEKRVGPQSMISTSPTSGFKHARLWPEYNSWSPETDLAPVNPQPILPSVFFVIADLHSGNHLEFLKTLQTLGTVRRLSEAVWIIAAQVDIDELRDVLGRNMTPEDRLFIHDSFSNRAGWFNIGENLDEDIRTLWLETAKHRQAMKKG